MKPNQSCSPMRRHNEFILSGNLRLSKLPSYKSEQDPHLASYFSTKRKSKKTLLNYPQPVYNIYTSSHGISPVKHRHQTPKLPRLKKLIKIKKVSPLTSLQFKQLLQKYRTNHAVVSQSNPKNPN